MEAPRCGGGYATSKGVFFGKYVYANNRDRGLMFGIRFRVKGS